MLWYRLQARPVSACYERFVKPVRWLRPRRAVRSSSSFGMTPRRGCQRASFGLHARGNEECRADTIGLVPVGGRPKSLVGLSFVSGWTREGITRTRRRRRLSPSHTLILESGRLCRRDGNQVRGNPPPEGASVGYPPAAGARAGAVTRDTP